MVVGSQTGMYCFMNLLVSMYILLSPLNSVCIVLSLLTSLYVLLHGSIVRVSYTGAKIPCTSHAEPVKGTRTHVHASLICRLGVNGFMAQGEAIDAG